jgi:AhpD family alkylhydroperoxidase
MPHLTPLTDEQASSEARPLFQGIQSAFSLVPNIFRSMGHAPAVLQATLALNKAIQTDLDPKLRELAYLKASQVNHCGYCLHYHSGLGRKSGLSDAQVKDLENYEGSGAYSDLEKKVLRFADQWTRQGKVDGELVADLAKSLSQKQLVTLAATVGLANWTNRFNETFGIELP